MNDGSKTGNADGPENGSVQAEARLTSEGSADEELDFSLLEDSLAKTPWERMQANDDALRFAESLRAAMNMRNAKPR